MKLKDTTRYNTSCNTEWVLIAQKDSGYIELSCVTFSPELRCLHDAAFTDPWL